MVHRQSRAELLQTDVLLLPRLQPFGLIEALPAVLRFQQSEGRSVMPSVRQASAPELRLSASLSTVPPPCSVLWQSSVTLSRDFFGAGTTFILAFW